MGRVLVLFLFVVIPIVELYVFVQAAQAWGFFNALGLIVLVSIIGVAVVRHQGLRVWRRFQEQAMAGEVPDRPIADGVALLLAGVLLIIPGFVTDTVGVLLLLPPVRSGLRALLVRRASRGMRGIRVIRATYGGPIDVDGRERGPGSGPTDEQPPRGELGQ